MSKSEEGWAVLEEDEEAMVGREEEEEDKVAEGAMVTDESSWGQSFRSESREEG